MNTRLKHNYSFLSPFLFLLLLPGVLLAQNTSNKGTDFWIGYTGHINGGSGTGSSSQMNLYITSNVNTVGTVSVPLGGWSVSFSITADSTTVIAVPPTVAYDGNSGTILNQGINVVALQPVVVFSHIYASDKSDATLALPVPTLGKEYYVMGFKQQNVTAGKGYAEFMVVGVQDSTQVQITPTATTTDGHAANVPFTITINQGQIFQLQAATDLTGSHIITFSNNNSACNRIAVFAGSTYTSLGCTGASTGDNLYQQLYPVNAWGNDFVTAPFKTRLGGDYFRVLAGSDSTLVTVNGGTPYLLNTAQFHDTLMATPNYITATKPITLAQFQRTQNCDNVTGDPSMTILSPIEQTLDTITVYSTKNYEITGEYINVIIKSDDTSNFRLDGNHVPFTVVPANPLYSYSQNTVKPYNHNLASDSGFNAIAYGFGNVESYGYSAGANVKNLVQYVNAGSNGISNPHILCNGATVNFTGIVSYKPLSTKWYFGDGDTSSVTNPTHTYAKMGVYIVSYVTVNGTSGNSCDTKDSSTYTLNIVGFPVAGFRYSNTCSNDSVRFTDTSNAGGGSIIARKWYFGDGDSSILQNPFHHYPSSGTYTTTLIINTNGGCSDTAHSAITITPLPIASAGSDQTICNGSAASLSTPAGLGYSYLWTPNTGITCATCASTKASPADTQTYIIRVTISACSNYDTVTVNVIKAVVNIASDTLNMCVGNSVLINSDIQPGQTYSWSPVKGLSCDTCSTTTASPGITTKYVLTASYEGCNAKDSVLVNVQSPGAGPDTSICVGSSVVLKAFPGGTGFTYSWSPTTGLSCSSCENTTATPVSFPATYHVTIVSSVCNATDSVVVTAVKVTADAGTGATICPGGSASLSASGGVGYQWVPSSGLSSPDIANPDASPTINTTYTVTVADAKGCTASDTVSVKLYPAFPISAGPLDTLVCPGDKINLRASGGTSYSWQPSGQVSNSSIENPTATVTGTITYTVTVTDAKGCTEETSANASIYELPVIYVTPTDTTICLNQPLQLSATGAVAYQWSGGEILSCGTCSTVSVGTSVQAYFTVAGTDMHGCIGYDTTQVILGAYCHFVIMPNAFSPNGDGKNDVFRPVGKGVTEVQYSIFNRWGEKIFTGTDMINGWDGTYKGKLQPIDSYSWILAAKLDDGTSVKLQGNVTLVR